MPPRSLERATPTPGESTANGGISNILLIETRHSSDPALPRRGCVQHSGLSWARDGQLSGPHTNACVDMTCVPGRGSNLTVWALPPPGPELSCGQSLLLTAKGPSVAKWDDPHFQAQGLPATPCSHLPSGLPLSMGESLGHALYGQDPPPDRTSDSLQLPHSLSQAQCSSAVQLPPCPRNPILGSDCG